MDIRKELGCLSTQILNSSPLSKSNKRLLFLPDEPVKGVDDLGTCETASLFKDLREFNSKFSSMRKEVVIHKLKFNLNEITLYTNNDVTETVIVYADTVYMTGPLEVSLELKVRARVVSISHPITVIFKANQMLPENDGIEEKYISFNECTMIMRQRTLGLVDIIDQHVVEASSSKCLPMELLSSDKNIDVGEWFDTTIMNMLNICSHVLLAENETSKLAQTMIDFVLAFYHRKTDFKDDTQYITGLKFMKYLKQQDSTKLHRVPNYNFKDIKELSVGLHRQFDLFDGVVRESEGRIYKMNLALLQSNQDYKLAEEMMTNLFNTEKELFKTVLKTANFSILLSADENEKRDKKR